MSTRWVHTANRGAVAIPLLAALSLLWLLRQPDWTSFTTLYIDDGIFLNQATVDPVGIFTPHNGYLHLLPRTIAAIAALLPLNYAPVVIALLCATVLFAAMVIVWWTVKNSERSWAPTAWMTAGLLALVPVASTETISVAACLQWQLIAAAIVATALGRIGRPTTIPLAALLVIAALSSPLALVLLPSAAWLAWMARREAQSWSIALLPGAALVAGLAVQALIVLNTSVSDEAIGTAEVDLLSSTTAVTFLEMNGPLALLGSPITRPIVSAGSIAVVVAFLACTLAVAIAARITGRAVTRQEPLTRGEFAQRLLLLFGPGVAVIAISLIIRPAVRTLSMGNPGGTRYVVPLAYAMWVIVVLAILALVTDARERREIGTRAGVLAGVGIVIAVGLLIVHWDYSLGRPDGPRWSAAFEQSCLGAQPGAVVPVSMSPPPWLTAVPCPPA